jgi:hypothetical protein
MLTNYEKSIIDRTRRTAAVVNIRVSISIIVIIPTSG